MYQPLRSSLLFLALLFPLAPGVAAQGTPPEREERGLGIRINGLGRSLIQQTQIGGPLMDTDTTTAETLADGAFLLDLAINAQPNDATEVQGIIRLRNEFGGFFGAGVTIEVRELWARGIVADVLRYRLGDMDLALTPYTLYLPEEDGVVNTPEVFLPEKEIIYHEEFYTGFNQRRLQGAHVDFSLAFDRWVDALDVRSFITRIRTTDFTTTPNRFIGGGRVAATSMPFGAYGWQARAGANLAYTWDDLDTGDANTGIRNPVVTLDADLTLLDRPAWAVHLVGEGGWSTIALKDGSDNAAEETLIDESDTFIEAGLTATLKAHGLGVSAFFVDVGPDFYSSAAQSKRIDYTRAKSVYHRIGNDRALRRISLFDLSRDPAVYTFRVADQLMRYDPRYSNVLPYGRATPNRRGARLRARYAPAESAWDAALDLALLREIRGQGTTELKDFVLARAEADLDVAALIGWQKGLGMTFGLQYEDTSRGGETVEQVDLTSTFVEAGISAEVYDRLDLLLGAKYRTSSGDDYVPLIQNFNDVRDFPARFATDDRETLWATGLRYRFAEDIYLTLQYQRFNYSDDLTPDDDYRLDRIFALFSMSF